MQKKTYLLENTEKCMYFFDIGWHVSEMQQISLARNKQGNFCKSLLSQGKGKTDLKSEEAGL